MFCKIKGVLKEEI
jgi:ABC-type multidrug transport system ATPase subunit